MHRSKALRACQLYSRDAGAARTYQSDILLERESADGKYLTDFYDDEANEEQLKFSDRILEGPFSKNLDLLLTFGPRQPSSTLISTASLM